MSENGFISNHLASIFGVFLEEYDIALRDKLANEVQAELQKRCLHERYEPISPFKCSYCTAAKVAAKVVRGKK